MPARVPGVTAKNGERTEDVPSYSFVGITAEAVTTKASVNTSSYGSTVTTESEGTAQPP
jgi:hypothetical protein